jgi:hypothetical protein
MVYLELKLNWCPTGLAAVFHGVRSCQSSPDVLFLRTVLRKQQHVVGSMMNICVEFNDAEPIPRRE